MSAPPWSRSASWRDHVNDEGPRWCDSKCREFFAPEEAGEEFVRALLELKWKHHLSAKALSVLCFFASTAGAVGTCRDLAAHPNKGHFQRKLDKVLRTHEEDDRSYEIDITFQVKLSDERMLAPAPYVPPHESLADEVAHDGRQWRTLQTMARTDLLFEVVLRAPPGANGASRNGVAVQHLRRFVRDLAQKHYLQMRMQRLVFNLPSLEIFAVVAVRPPERHLS